MIKMEEIIDNVVSGKAPETENITQKAIDDGVSPEKILTEGLIAAMEIVGDKFKKNEFYVPDMLIAARAMKAGLKILQPHLTATGVKPIGTFVIGTVKGDLHDIGKNLVAMMMEGAGFKVIDLGVDVTPEKFVAAVDEHQPQIIGMSALLTTTMVNMKKVIEALESDGKRNSVKVIVGGAPLSRNYAEDIGADGYVEDASGASELSKKLIANGN